MSSPPASSAAHSPSARKKRARRARKRERTRKREEAEELLCATDGSDGLLVSLVLVFAYLGALALFTDLWAVPREALLGFLDGFMAPGDGPVLAMAVGGTSAFFGLVMLLIGAQERARGRLRTASVQGELISNQVVVVPNLSGDTGMKTERHVRFAYEVDGERHEGRQVYRLFTAFGGPTFGKPFMVYYQPGWPKNAGLRPAWRERAYGSALAIALGCPALVAGLMAHLA